MPSGVPARWDSGKAVSVHLPGPRYFPFLPSISPSRATPVPEAGEAGCLLRNREWASLGPAREEGA